jgi:GalNAc5-diNAcBac-PP-undecaprenol beta-1,3-glucosyltransferase
MPTVSVIIPTHDHQDTLRIAIASIQRQTVQDFEVFVIGDGAPERTREIMAELCAADSRIHYFDYPKGPRHGEIYRDELIRTTINTPYICYLGDDDIWLPHHLEVMTQALQRVDFVHTLHINVHVDGTLNALLANLHSPSLSKLVERRIQSGFGLSFGAHTRAAYLALPKGWETTPVGCYTDLYLWSKFVSAGTSRASLLLPTCLHLAAPERQTDSPTTRLNELTQWLEKSGTDHFLPDLWRSLSYDNSILLNYVDTSAVKTLADLLSLHRIESKRVEMDQLPSLTAWLERDMRTALVGLTDEQHTALELYCLQHVGQISPSKAKARWLKLFGQRPWDSKVRLALARCFGQKGEWDVVEELLLLSQAPENYTEEYIELYVDALLAQGNLDSAEPVLIARLARSPLSANLLMQLAEIKLQRNQLDAAIEVLTTALERDRKRKIPILQKLIQLQTRLGNPPEVLSAYEQLTQLQPYEPTVHLQAAMSAVDVGNFEKALHFLTRTLELDPHQALAYFHKCQVLNKQQQPEQAKAVALAGLTYCPKDAAIQTQLGISHFRLAEYEAAIQAFDQALQQDPQRSGAYTHKCLALLKLQQPERAKAVALTGLSHCPDDASIRVQLGNSHMHLKEYEAALQELDRALELDPRRLQAYILQCQTLTQLQQPDRAKAVAKLGLAYFPNSKVLQEFVEG